MSDVTYTRKDYDAALPDWLLVSDACAGERSVKARGATYLPRPNPLDQRREAEERYRQYLARACYYNATGRTLAGLVGAAFRVDPVAKFPAALKYLETDASGAGVSVYQQSQATLANVLQKGRHALYVDYPATESPATLAQQRAGQIRANIITVNAEQVINWRTVVIGGVHKLALVVIREIVEEIDGFGVAEVEQWRALELAGGAYSVTVWRKNEKGEPVIVSQVFPRDGAGNVWDQIPFTFVGAQNNDHSVDTPPLVDLARVNIAHYRNSADYEDSVFFVGQVQPYIIGVDDVWAIEAQKAGLYIGSRSPIMLPLGASFGLAQAAPNSMVREAMQDKERQMIALGARLISKGEAVKTATEAQADSEVEHSVLSLCVKNVSEAYTQAIRWCARFMNAPDSGIEYSINTQFAEKSFDPQALTALVAAWQAGRIPSSDMTANLQRMGVISSEKSQDDVAGELELETAGLGLDQPGSLNDGNATGIN